MSAETLQEAATSLPEEFAALAGLTPISDGGGLFCGVPENFAIGNRRYQWPKGSHLKWSIGFSRLGVLSDMDCKDLITESLREISSCCNVTHEFTTGNNSNLNIVTARMDGPSGVLADCGIPTNVSPKTTLRMRFDSSERYGNYENPPNGSIDFYRVFLHEALHWHGLGHKPANVGGSALIAPMYSTRIRNLQKLDIQELVLRYGEATGIKPPSPTGSSDGIWIWVPGGKSQATNPNK